jgi:hypothetical protein
MKHVKDQIVTTVYLYFISLVLKILFNKKIFVGLRVILSHLVPQAGMLLSMHCFYKFTRLNCEV